MKLCNKINNVNHTINKKECDDMKVKLKQSITFVQLAELFQLPECLIRASNLTYKNEMINKNETIKIPGYTSVKHKVNINDTFESLSHSYKIKQQLLELINGKHSIEQYLFIPTRKTELIIDDINNYTYEKMNNHIDQLIHTYPFINKKVIGYSVLKRPIYELTIGNGPYYTHFNASFHGNEWITTPALLQCVNEYARLLTDEINDQSIINAFDKTTISIVPMVNPDGVDLVVNGLESAGDFTDAVFLMNESNEDFSRWKANINGIDLNKQFPANWDLEQNRKYKYPTFRDFPGKSPLSQPESIAMATLTKHNNFHRVHALHTQGEEIYWGFQKLEPMIAEKIVSQYALVSNYKAVRNIDNYAGYKDWFIKTFRQSSF